MKPAAPPAAVRVLAIDDLESIHEDYRKILQPVFDSHALDADELEILGVAPAPLRPIHFELHSAFDGLEGFTLVEKSLAAGAPYAVAFVDMRMPPGWDGLETIQRIWSLDPDIQIVICTAYSDYSWSDTIKILGHPENLIVLKKPFDQIEVLQLAFALARKWLLAREVKSRVANLDELVRQRTSELTAAEQRFEKSFSASPLPQFLQSLADATILEVNAAFEACFGIVRAQSVGRRPEDTGLGIDAAAWSGFAHRLRAGESIEDASLVRRAAGRPAQELRCFARPVDIAGRPCVIWIVRDVTAQVALEGQLRQAQKMEALGQLAAGIAHDFNNLLTVITCYTSELLVDEARDPRRLQLESVQAAALRAAGLTRQLLVFSRKDPVQQGSIALTEIARELAPMLRRLIPENVALDWNIPDQLPDIHGDQTSLEQIIINLVVNARDALAGPGRVTIAARTGEFAAGSGTTPPGAGGHFVALSVTDNGPGIPPSVLPHIFEPFFTTKKTGEGTGLGLATVHSLAHQHGGWIDVQTRPGAGTTFTVYRPVISAAPPPSSERAPRADPSAPLRPCRVLVAEDDAVFGTMLRCLLERRGLVCVVATDGRMALDLWETDGPFDLLISDVIMPNGLSGIELAQNLRTQAPALPVILTSGYNHQNLRADVVAMAGEKPVILPKPFAVPAFLDAVQAATTGRSASHAPAAREPRRSQPDRANISPL